MVAFTFVRQNAYPDLDIEVGIRLNENRSANYTACAWLKATGSPGSREKWRRDFWQWAESRELDACTPRYGNRRSEKTSTYDCYLKTWQVVADFIVCWVGLGALEDALTDSATSAKRHEEAARRYEDATQNLTKAIGNLDRQVADLRGISSRQEEAYRTIGAAMLSVRLLPPAL